MKCNRSVLLLVLALAACSADSLAEAPATRGSVPPATQSGATDLGVRIGAAVAEFAARVRSGGDPAAAATALLKIPTTYLGAMASYADDEDPEVQLRLGHMLGRAVEEARFQRVRAKLPARQGNKLLRLRREQPDIVQDVFSADLPRRIKAVKRIADMPDSAGLAEPLLVICLRHPSRQLQAAAAHTVALGRYRSDAVVDALVSVLTRTTSPEWASGYWNSSDPPRHLAALGAVQVIKSPRAAPVLLKLMSQRQIAMPCRSLIAESLGKTGQRAAIPHLLKQLEDRAAHHIWSLGGPGGTTAQSDLALLALLGLTRQSPDSYGLMCVDQQNYLYVGFPDQTARGKAITKFKKWWASNRSKPPYRDLKALPLEPARPADSAGTRPSSETRPSARSQPVSQPAWPDTRSLRADLDRRTRWLVEQFRARSFRRRRDAQAELLRLACAWLDPLVALAEDADPGARKLALDALTATIAEARIEQTRAALPAAKRDTFTRFRKENPRIVADVFSLSWARQKEAIERIGKRKDPQRLAEPLLAAMLKHPSKYNVEAAANVLAGGTYRSDGTVDALADFLKTMPANDWYKGWYTHRNEPAPHVGIVDALQAIRTPRAAATLLELLLERQRSSYYRYVPLAEALIATGQVKVLPRIVARLAVTPVYSRWTANKTTITMAASDNLLMVAVKLTGQKPEDYRFVYSPRHMGSRRYKIYGFKNETDRKWGIAKFKSWWAKHRNDGPWRDLQPASAPGAKAKP